MKTATETRLNQTEAPAPATYCQEAARRFEAGREKFKGATEMALRFVREHPVRCVVGAFEAGMLVGLLRARRR